MKKVIVIGCPGSGKSTFSKALHQITGIELIHLDRLFWNADQTSVEKSVFLTRLSEAMNADEWILDGNYASTMEMRMQACDTVIFLDYPTQVCLDGIEQRKGKARSDMPWVEPDRYAPEFLDFIKGYRAQSRPQVKELLSRYSHKDIYIFSARAQAEEFLAQLRR